MSTEIRDDDNVSKRLDKLEETARDLDRRLDELEKSVGVLSQNMATTVNALSSYEDYVNNRLIKLGSSSAHLIAAVQLLTEARE